MGNDTEKNLEIATMETDPTRWPKCIQNKIYFGNIN